MGGPGGDAPFYTDEELDALYRRDPLEAMRISRRQAQLARELAAGRSAQADAPPPSAEEVLAVLERTRRVLQLDGGDLELVELAGRTLRVRMKGNCVGCPRATLDLKNVVEKTVREHFPQIERVENVF